MRPAASLFNSHPWLTTTAPGDLMGEVLPWLLVLLGLVIVGAIVVHIVRPSKEAEDDGSGSAAGFTLQDLRNLRASGDLSDEEFERARAAMLERVSRTTSENSRRDDDVIDGDHGDHTDAPDKAHDAGGADGDDATNASIDD